MEDTQIESEVEVVTEETTEEAVATTEEETKTTQEPKVEKPKETLEARKSRLERELKQVHKKLGIEPEEKVEAKTSTGELDETQLDYLDLKGISEDEDIEIIQKVMKKTGQTLRQALKDDYVISKLKENKKEREVKTAIPSSTKRSAGGSSTDIQAAIAKFEQTGKLPDDFALRSAVINAKVESENTNKPAWHK